ncbi:MAG: hypothetical protein JWQ06_317 [Mucilaginibacter sp.]|nr:hypothetical protein [Mucilaginibacter sp.]
MNNLRCQLRADGVLPEREAISSPALSALLLISDAVIASGWCAA